jgi:hypothetical protein
MFGMAAFVMIGFNMLAQVDWNPIQFVRQLFWLSLDPPAPKYGLTFPPMNEGRLVVNRRLSSRLFQLCCGGIALIAARLRSAWERMCLGHLPQPFGCS